MSCPLSAILNEGDDDTPNTFNAFSGTGRPLAALTRIPLTVPLNAASQQIQRASHNWGASLDTGSLYIRHTRTELDTATTTLPSPPGSDPPLYQITSNDDGIFNRLLDYPELIFEMVSHLSVDDLLALYSISRSFHTLANTRFTTMILSQSLSHAPESSHIFPFRCYRSLCLRDPAMRPNSAKPDFQIRHVPGFQWLKMILFREHVVDGIVACLEKEGLMLPAATTLTIKKIWFFMDLSTNKLRDAIIRNTDYWTEEDLYLAHLFLMKLDMLFTCPLTGEADLGLRKMLLGQRSLSTLLRVLRREEMRNSYEMMKMIVAWNYRRNDQQIQLNQSIFGIPPNRIGMLQYEGWGRNPGALFHQIDELVTWESVRRGLDMPSHYLDMVLYGFVDKRTGLDIWTRDQKRRQEEEREREGRGDGKDTAEYEKEADLEGFDRWIRERVVAGYDDDLSDDGESQAAGDDDDGGEADQGIEDDDDEFEAESERLDGSEREDQQHGDLGKEESASSPNETPNMEVVEGGEIV
ncbi:MAG: hypothetical protein Q9213_004786 [Squamulea squamosa]